MYYFSHGQKDKDNHQASVERREGKSRAAGRYRARSAGINIQDFCKQFNDATKDMVGDVVPAEISIYEDRTFSFVLKTPPASALLKKAAGIEGRSKIRSKSKVGTVTKAQIREIAEKKMPDLNANDLEAAEKSSREPRATWESRSRDRDQIVVRIKKSARAGFLVAKIYARRAFTSHNTLSNTSCSVKRSRVEHKVVLLWGRDGLSMPYSIL